MASKGTPITFSGKPKQSKLKHTEPLIPMLGHGVKSPRRVSRGWKKKPTLRSRIKSIRNKYGV